MVTYGLKPGQHSKTQRADHSSSTAIDPSTVFATSTSPNVFHCSRQREVFTAPRQRKAWPVKKVRWNAKRYVIYFPHSDGGAERGHWLKTYIHTHVPTRRVGSAAAAEKQQQVLGLHTFMCHTTRSIVRGMYHGSGVEQRHAGYCQFIKQLLEGTGAWGVVVVVRGEGQQGKPATTGQQLVKGPTH